MSKITGYPKFRQDGNQSPQYIVYSIAMILLPWVAWKAERSTPPFLCAARNSGPVRKFNSPAIIEADHQADWRIFEDAMDAGSNAKDFSPIV